jgi:hypothetical protein
MTPAEVYAMDDDEYLAFVGWMREEQKARERAARSRR